MDIVVDGNLNNNPRLAHIRMTVLDVVTDCYYDGVAAVLSSHLELKIDDVIVALKYCTKRQCDLDGGHCGGCSLRLSDDGVNNIADFVNRFAEIKFIDSDETILGKGEGVMIMPGKARDLDLTWKGVDGWVLAESVLTSLL